jgi:hypothetical protein
MTGSVGRRDGFGFLRFHFFTAAFQLAYAGFSAKSFCAALGTLESFSQLTCHFVPPAVFTV